MARRVILDTNFLLIPAADKIDIFSEMERVVSGKVVFCIMDGTIGELDRMGREGSAKEKRQVRLAQAIVAAKQIEVVSQDTALIVDDAILCQARPGDIVATMDKELRQRLKKKGVDTAVLRKRQHVVLLEA